MLKANSFAKKLVVGLLSATLLVPTSISFASSSEDISARISSTTSSVYKELGPVENLGKPIAQLTVFDAVGGKRNGEDYLYVTSSGSPGVLNVLNITTNTVEQTINIEPGATVWAQQLDTVTGNVYIATSGEKKLYVYKPGTSTVEYIGDSPAQIWSLTSDDEGNVYGGTFQPGNIIKYSPATGQIENWGSIKEGHEYVRSIAYHDGYIYAGLGSKGGLIKIDKNDPTNKVEIPLKKLAAQAEGEASPFVYSLDVKGDYLFAHLSNDSHKSYIIYDLVNENWVDVEAINAPGLHVSDVKDNKVYFTSNGKIVYFDLNSNEIVETTIEEASSFRSAFWAQPKGYTNEVLVNVSYGGSVVYYDFVANTRTVETPMFVGGGLEVHTLETGTNGKLYMTGYTGAISKEYDPTTNSWRQFKMGQSESIGVSGSKIYFGEYPGAKILMLDTANSTMLDPIKVLEVGNKQDRPYVNTFGDGYAFFGHIPTYGVNGGALAVFKESDPENTLEVYSDIVKDQSIVGLAYKDGIIYGSTSIHGGLDSKTISDPAKLFTFDVENGKKLDEWELKIPGYNGNITFISGLTFDENGLLWVVANGYILALDPETKAIVKQQDIFPDVSAYGKWRPVHVRFHEGLIYTDMYGQMVIVDPNSLEYNILGISTVLFTLDQAGDLYYSQGANLYKRTLTDLAYIPAGKLDISAPTRVGLTDEFTVKIKSVNAKALNSGEVKLSFNSSKLELLNVTGANTQIDNTFIQYRVDGDNIHILFTEIGSSSGVDGSVDLLNLTFKANGNIADVTFTLKAESTTAATHAATSNLTYAIGENKIAVSKILNSLDITGDGQFNIADLISVSKRVGTSLPQYDVNYDGVVNHLDVIIVSEELLKNRKK